LAHRICIDARKIEDFGIGTYIRNLITHLAEVDLENRYVLLTRGTREFPLTLPDNFQVLQERAPVYSIRELGTLSWRLLRLDVDLYHATHYVLPAVVPCAAVATIHDIIHLLYPEFLPSRLAFFYAQRMIRRTLTRGDRIIAVSKNTKADLARYFEVDGGKIHVVYNGVDDLFRRRLPEEEITRWLRSLEVERPYVLFVGNAAKPHKNLDNVVRAFARARKRHPFEARLVCVGERGPATFKIEQRAAQLGISDRLVMLGHVAREALPALYQGATLFVYPTLYEGFGLPVVEAMASGVPVVTSNTSALKEVAEGHAHLVDPLNVDAIAEAIAHCMADPQHRASLARLGLRRAEEFGWRRTAERTLEIYRGAIAAAARGRHLWGGRSGAVGRGGGAGGEGRG
jgi:glycosyltransferase involved in cell wall biosynthesis